jgi:hypothetical protein
MGNYGKLAIHPLGPDVVMDLLNSWNLLQHWVMVSKMCLMSTIYFRMMVPNGFPIFSGLDTTNQMVSQHK